MAVSLFLVFGLLGGGLAAFYAAITSFSFILAVAYFMAGGFLGGMLAFVIILIRYGAMDDLLQRPEQRSSEKSDLELGVAPLADPLKVQPI